MLVQNTIIKLFLRFEKVRNINFRYEFYFSKVKPTQNEAFNEQYLSTSQFQLIKFLNPDLQQIQQSLKEERQIDFLSTIDSINSYFFYKDQFENKVIQQYSYLCEMYLGQEKNLKSQQEKLQEYLNILKQIAEIKEKNYYITTQKIENLARFLVKNIQQISKDLVSLQFQECVSLLRAFSVFDLRRENEIKLIVKTLKSQYTLKKTDLTWEMAFEILKNFNQLRFQAEYVMMEQMICQPIFDHMELLSLNNLAQLLKYLYSMKFKLNQVFLIKLAFYSQHQIDESNISTGIKILNYVSLLEKLIIKQGTYLFQLQNFYEHIFDLAESQISVLNTHEMSMLLTSISRASFYREKIVKFCLEKSMTLEFEDFNETSEIIQIEKKLMELEKSLNEQPIIIKNDQRSAKETQILDSETNLLEKDRLKQKLKEAAYQYQIENNSLQFLFRLIHTVGVLNIKLPQEFILYFSQVLQLFREKMQQLKNLTSVEIPHEILTQAMWGLCVVSSPSEIPQIIKILNGWLFQTDDNNYQIHIYDIGALYLVYQYLGVESHIFSKQTSSQIVQSYKTLRKSSPHQISMITMEISTYLRKLQVPHSIQENIDNFFVDLVVKKEYIGNKRLIIDIHGYQHFFRDNPEKVRGNSILKKQLLQSQNQYIYCYIPLYEWESLLSENGQLEYLQNLFQTIQQAHNIEN